MPATAQQTGTSDRLYDLVSVLHHALKGAESCDKYILDAEREGDQPLASFFTEVRDGYRMRVERAKQFLGARLACDQPRDAVDEASMESFPGSDAPARTSSVGATPGRQPACG